MTVTERAQHWNEARTPRQHPTPPSSLRLAAKQRPIGEEQSAGAANQSAGWCERAKLTHCVNESQFSYILFTNTETDGTHTLLITSSPKAFSFSLTGGRRGGHRGSPGGSKGLSGGLRGGLQLKITEQKVIKRNQKHFLKYSIISASFMFMFMFPLFLFIQIYL